jgi:hypothetical protein
MAAPLHVVSWNVAGWARTLAQIVKFHGSLRAWVERHQSESFAAELALIPVFFSSHQTNTNS